MGGDNYDRDTDTSSSNVNTFNAERRSREAQRRRRQAGVPSDRLVLDPLVNIKEQVRECRDSEEYPNTTPIVIVLDGTKSNEKNQEIMWLKLPMFIGQLIGRDVLERPVLSICVVGDATAGDHLPLQVSQFEADNKLDEILAAIQMEGKGGGTGQESYELPAYFYARKTVLDANERGKKGYLFFVGDEGFYDKVRKDQVKVFIGDDLSEDVSISQIFSELQEKYHSFFIYIKKDVEERRADIDAEIATRVRNAGGQYDDVDFRASLLWNNRNDLDLHVIDPNGVEIFYGNKRPANSTAWLDVDMNVRGETTKPVENIRCPKGTAIPGVYRVFVRNYGYHESYRGATNFRVEVEINGIIQHFENSISGTGRMSDVLIGAFTYDPMIVNDREEVYAAYADEVILAQWRSVLPRENVLIITEAKAFVDVMRGVISILEEKTDLDEYDEVLEEIGQTNSRRTVVRSALSDLASSVSLARVDMGSLSQRRRRTRQGNTDLF